MAANDELKEGIQLLYQVARSAGVAADVHERCLKAAQSLMNHFEETNASNNSDEPTIVMPDARETKTEKNKR